MFIWQFGFAFVLVSVSGQEGDEGPPFSCYEYIEDKVEILYSIPDRQQLLDFCPDAKQFADCRIQQAIHNERDHEEFMKEIHSERSLVYDLCDEESDLHKTYAASADCYRFLLDKVPVCLSIAEDFYNDFRELHPHLGLISTEEINEDDQSPESIMNERKPYCIKESYKTACIGTEIMESCGSEAYNLYSEVLRRTLEMKGFCFTKENYNLRLTFLDFLATEKKHENIDIIAEMFHARRK